MCDVCDLIGYLACEQCGGPVMGDRKGLTMCHYCWPSLPDGVRPTIPDAFRARPQRGRKRAG